MTGKVHALELDAPAGAGARRFNALRHGVLSRYVVLPWEDADAYGGGYGVAASKGGATY